MNGKLKVLTEKAADHLHFARMQLVGVIEKGFERVRLSRVTVSSNLDLSSVPNYVAYRAALVREKMLLQHICLGLATLLVVIFVLGRIEVSDLSGRLRTKEYILAPGVSDFVPVAPQSVPDVYIQHAVWTSPDFVERFVNSPEQILSSSQTG